MGADVSNVRCDGGTGRPLSAAYEDRFAYQRCLTVRCNLNAEVVGDIMTELTRQSLWWNSHRIERHAGKP